MKNTLKNWSGSLTLTLCMLMMGSSPALYAANSSKITPAKSSTDVAPTAPVSRSVSLNSTSQSSSSNNHSAVPQALDSIAAIVNDSVITENSVVEMMNNIKNNPNKSQNLPTDAELRKQVLDYLISNELMIQEATKQNIQVSDAQLQQAIAEIAANNNTTVNAMLAVVNKEGISTRQYEEQVRNQIMIEEVRSMEVGRNISIQPQEVQSLVKQIGEHQASSAQLNLSYVLIPLPEHPTTEQTNQAMATAQSIVKAAQTESLKQAAAPYQQVKESELGWNTIDQFPSIFTSALQTANQGDVIGPLSSGAGLNIVKVNEIKGDANKKVQVTEYHIRHILLQTSPILSDTQAKQRLANLATQISSKKISFADAAKEFSQDVMTADKGGDLGWVHVNNSHTPFAAALSSLKVNQLSAPIKTEYGWQLIQLLGTRQVDATQATQKEQAYNILYNQKFNEAFPLWLQQLHDSAYIKIFPLNKDES